MHPAFNRLALAAALACLASTPPARAQVRFAVTDLGNFGGASAGATAINDLGVVGGSWHMPGAVGTAFVWSQGSVSNPFAGYLGNVNAIGNNGQVVGDVLVNGALTAARSMAGNVTVMGSLGQAGSRAQAVSGNGTIVGVTSITGGSYHAFATDSSGQMQDLGTLQNADTSWLYALNDQGTMAGVVSKGNVYHAALYRAGSWLDLGTYNSGDISVAYGLNNANVAVGSSNVTPGYGAQAVVFANGGVTLLGTMQGTSQANAINNNGQIVGYALPGANNTRYGFISTGIGMINLNDHLASPGGITVADANAVNTLGQIAGTSANGHALLLTPTGTVNWVAAQGGRYADVNAWDAGLGFTTNKLLPGVIAPNASQTVVVDANASALWLQVGKAGGGQVNLQLAGGATLSTVNFATLGAGTTLSGDGHLAGGAVGNWGTVLATPGQALWVDAAMTNHGSITGNGALHLGLNNAIDGTVTAGPGQRLQLLGSGHSNQGVIEVWGGGQLQTQGVLSNQAGGSLRLDNARLNLSGGAGQPGLVNDGTVQISFGGASIAGQVVNHAGAQVLASGAAQVTFWDAVTNDGEMRAAAGAQLVYFGLVNGGGSFTTQGNGAYHRFEAGYTPGHSPAAVSLGDVQFASTLTMELGGTTPGTGHDQISFTGSVLFDVGSVLDVTLINGFSPVAGQHFQLFNFSQAPQGQWGSLHLPGLGQGLSWDTHDLMAGGVLGVQAVPEPGTWALWLVGLAAMGRLGRRRPGQTGTV